MKTRYRIVKVPNSGPNKYRVQYTAPWPLSLIVGWEFVGPWLWLATEEEAQAEIERRMADDGYGAEVVRHISGKGKAP